MITFDHAEVPLWAAITGSAFLLIGAFLTLVGTIGLVRLPTFYERIHAPTLGTSWGAAGMIMGSIIIFSSATARPVLHEILIGIFITATTPVTLMMLGRSALYRDRSELNPGIPPKGANEHFGPPEKTASGESAENLPG